MTGDIKDGGAAIEKVRKRFLAKVNRREDGCWLWEGALNGAGYGHMVFQGRMVGSHRVSWFLENGEMPDSKHLVCHHCDTPRCVRPDHLFLGTTSENAIDMRLKGRGGNQVLDADQVTEIYRLAHEGMLSYRQIGGRYGISIAQVGHIKTGFAWSYVTGHPTPPEAQGDE